MGSPIDLDAILRTLSAFSDPATFLDLMPPITAIQDDDYFRNPAYLPLREAWAAGRFAMALERRGHNVQVRLSGAEERFPDFHVISDGTEYQFEFTEALPPDRKRGDEYRQYIKAPTAIRPYRNVRREEGEKFVADAIARKAEKYYAGKPHLLVYADFSGDGIRLEDCLGLCEQHSRAFASVWILMALSVAKLFDSGTFPDAAMTAFAFE